MEAALALRQRYPTAPGYTLASHLVELADLLQEIDRPLDAETYYQKVADSHEFSAYAQRWAWKGLAKVAIGLQDWPTAERCAQKSLDLARTVESPKAMMLAFDTLGDVYWQQSKVELAIEAKIQAWQYLRQYREEDDLYELSHDFAEIRLYQARQGQPQRYIPKAQQWLHRAMVWAVRLDRQVNSIDRQTKIRALQAECLTVLNDVIDRASEP
jgi:tetratricopeptide (TPR) repeat protein